MQKHVCLLAIIRNVNNHSICGEASTVSQPIFYTFEVMPKQANVHPQFENQQISLPRGRAAIMVRP